MAFSFSFFLFFHFLFPLQVSETVTANARLLCSVFTQSLILLLHGGSFILCAQGTAKQLAIWDFCKCVQIGVLSSCGKWSCRLE